MQDLVFKPCHSVMEFADKRLLSSLFRMQLFTSLEAQQIQVKNCVVCWNFLFIFSVRCRPTLLRCTLFSTMLTWYLAPGIRWEDGKDR